MDDEAIRAAFPNSPELLEAKQTVDPAVSEAFPNSPEMFPQESAAQQRARWVEAVRSEHGAAFDQTLTDARGVLAQFGDADLKAALNESGLGSHPAVVRFVAKVAKAMNGK